MVDFKVSETRKNLLRAFAGESQARNRYTFAAGKARSDKLYFVEYVFKFVAGQEKEHAEIFYKHLLSCAGQNIEIDAAYPIDSIESTLSLLKSAEKHEYEEYGDIYRSFADKAKNEGYLAVAESFNKIAEIEKKHGDRFKAIAELIESGKMFVSDVECGWCCLNCGYEFNGKAAPEMCPVCQHDKGYFIRAQMLLNV